MGNWQSSNEVKSYHIHHIRKKQQNELENTLEQRIKHLTSQYTNNPNKPRTQLESIIHKKTQFPIQQLKYENFQYSNKSSKYLANLLQHKKEKAIIPSILNSTGIISQNPQEINNAFQKCYTNLYSLDHEPNQSETDTFLNNLDIPTQPKEQVNI